MLRPRCKQCKAVVSYVSKAGLCLECAYAAHAVVKALNLKKNEDPFQYIGRLPSCPTKALPGSPQKIKIMTERAARWESLFHPGDGTFSD